MSLIQTVKNPMCLNYLSCNIITDKMYMYNRISTNMHESHPLDFLDQQSR